MSNFPHASNTGPGDGTNFGPAKAERGGAGGSVGAGGEWALCAKEDKGSVNMGLTSFFGIYRTVNISNATVPAGFENPAIEYVGNGRFQNKTGAVITAKGFVDCLPHANALTNYNLVFTVGLWDGAVVVPDVMKEKSFPTTVGVNVGNSNIDGHIYEYEIEVPIDGIWGFCVKRTNNVLINSDCSWKLFTHTVKAVEAVVVPPVPCDPVTLVNYDSGIANDVVINPVTNEITLTALTAGNTDASLQISTESFISQSALVAFEVTFNSCDQAANATNCIAAFTQSESLAAPQVGFAVLPASDLTFDVASGMPLDTGILIPDGSTFMIELNTATGTAAYKCESLAIAGSLTVGGTYDNLLAMHLAAGGELNQPAIIGESVVYTLNSGDTPFVNSTSGVGICDV